MLLLLALLHYWQGIAPIWDLRLISPKWIQLPVAKLGLCGCCAVRTHHRGNRERLLPESSHTSTYCCLPVHHPVRSRSQTIVGSTTIHVLRQLAVDPNLNKSGIGDARCVARGKRGVIDVAVGYKFMRSV